MVEERFVDVGDARVRTLERQGDGETVLFLHGITSSASTWKPSLEALPEGMRGIAYDTLGNAFTELHGPRRRLTLDDHARQVVEVADVFGVERFAGIGHSMGAAPLLRVAWQQPERVRGLLLEAPTALGRPKMAMQMRLARYGPSRWLLERLATPDRLRTQARRNLRNLAGREVDDEMLEREAGHAIADPKRELRGYVDLLGHGNPRAPAADVDRYPRIECPVWILLGAEDRFWVPESAADRFRSLIPGARVERWEGIGHAPHIQVPERFTALLDEFLASL